jgi:hypothetical protein
MINHESDEENYPRDYRKHPMKPLDYDINNNEIREEQYDAINSGN